jgi:hypothetical protein
MTLLDHGRRKHLSFDKAHIYTYNLLRPVVEPEMVNVAEK